MLLAAPHLFHYSAGTPRGEQHPQNFNNTEKFGEELILGKAYPAGTCNNRAICFPWSQYAIFSIQAIDFTVTERERNYVKVLQS